MASNPQAHSGRGTALLIGLLSRLPLRLLYVLSDLLFVILFRLFGYQRRLLVANLSRAFPENSPAQLQRLAATTYRHALDFLVESIKAWRFSAGELRRRVEIENPQLPAALLSRHKIVIALTSHCGNWEWSHLACAAQLGTPLAALYNPLNHAGLDQCLHGLRSRFGSTLIDATRALPGLLAFAGQGGVIALNADQSPRPDDEKYWADFLGIETAFFTGPQKLARLFQAPVVYVRMQRLRRGYYRLRFEPLAQPPYAPAGDDIASAYVGAVEAHIQAAPADWFWLYKRWKYNKPLY